jgi:hypothetical protein
LSYTEEEYASEELSLAPIADSAEQRARFLEQLGVNAWCQAGQRGQGLKVAILDTGFRGYRQQVGKALPSKITMRSFRFDGNPEARDSQHGILCAEVLHALAPDAQMLLANWEPERSDQFLDAVRWACQEGAQVISCSIIMPSWSDCEGNGPIHEALTQILGKGDRRGDRLFFACAGNTAQRHWSGAFKPDREGFHVWGRGQNLNAIRPWGADRVSVEICWQPGASYEISVIDPDRKEEIGRSRTAQGTNPRCAVVAFAPEPDHNYAVQVRQTSRDAEGPGRFHVVVLGGNLDQTTSRGSIPFPGDGPEVITVGAVDLEGHRYAYSSCGPNSSTPKPDLVAPVPFPSLWRSRPFAGTSAAAPQAAGMAALLWGRHPDWAPLQVRRALQRTAVRGAPGRHDVETGFGRISLPTLQTLRPPLENQGFLPVLQAQ